MKKTSLIKTAVAGKSMSNYLHGGGGALVGLFVGNGVDDHEGLGPLQVRVGGLVAAGGGVHDLDGLRRPVHLKHALVQHVCNNGKGNTLVWYASGQGWDDMNAPTHPRLRCQSGCYKTSNEYPTSLIVKMV